MRYFSIALVILGTACTGKPTPIPQADSAGGELYQSRCGACHVVPHPKRLDFAGWRHMLKVMERQMQHKKMAPLSDDERRAILAYLKRHAR